MEKADNSRRIVRFEGFELDLRAGELSRRGEKAVQLSDQPFRILAMLLARPGDLVTREEIRSKLWPNGTIVEFEHSINAAMNRLRHVLDDSSENPRYIETLARRGYRWKTPVEWVESSPEAATPAELVRGKTAAAGNLIGKKVSHYRVLEVLGGGGMGVVYKAEDLRLGRRVALKFLPEELASDPDALNRFEREAQAASALSHPNICTIFEIEDHEEQPFIVMELLEGETLRELISAAAAKSTAQPLPQVLDLAIQIAGGLDAAHRKGIIHRDIKPTNIFVTKERQAKILDFGLAKLATATEPFPEGKDGSGNADRAQRPATSPGSGPELSFSRTGAAMGTAGYMSPEQVRGEKLDARTDLFSFGLVLYEMATGQRAFIGDTAPILHDAILGQTPLPVRQVNPDLPPKLEQIIDRALEKERELRYQSAAEMRVALQSAADGSRQGSGLGPRALLAEEKEGEEVGTGFTAVKALFFARSHRRLRNWILSGAAAAILLTAGSVLFFHPPRRPALGETDMILVSDFVNTTGDPIFDGTLKQALTIKLAESPYFNIMPDSRVKETLGLMGRSSDEHVLTPIAREVCQRAGGKVTVSGSIMAVGDKYVIGLRATNCLTGADIAHEEIEAQNRDRVLSSLGQVILPLRHRLGELVSSIQKFDTPIEQATTKSLAALKAYTSGDQQRARGLDGQSVPFYKMAIDLDPDFAVAYARLGAVYGNLANSALADEYLTKAFERRGHVSEREKFYIAAHYYADSTRETDKAIETLKLWTQTYPHDWVAFNNLSAEAVKVGQLDEAIKAGQEALQLNPGNTFTYFSLSTAYLRASHFVEANAICEQAIKAKRDSGDIHATLLNLAFVNGDEPEIQRQLDRIEINAKLDPGSLNQRAWMAFARGQAGKGRDLFERSRVASLQQGNDSPENSKDYAAFSSANEAQLEVELGNVRQARAKAELALRLMPRSLEVQSYAAIVFASLGDFRRAERLTRELTSRFPSDTLLNNVTLPAVHAIIETKKKNYSGAIDALKRSMPYELGSHQDLPEGITLYQRGLAYLAQGSGEEAAAQFQKLLENRGIVPISPYWALAHLGLARANVLEARTDQGVAANAARALANYRDFFALWKDADPDIPILKQAKAEYAKLK